jgi:hypothetical protein
LPALARQRQANPKVDQLAQLFSNIKTVVHIGALNIARRCTNMYAHLSATHTLFAPSRCLPLQNGLRDGKEAFLGPSRTLTRMRTCDRCMRLKPLPSRPSTMTGWRDRLQTPSLRKHRFALTSQSQNARTATYHSQ